MNRFQRRRFLLALGAAGVCSAFESLGKADPEGSARSRSGRPSRFIGIYTPHGRAHELWQPRTGFDISYPDSVLAPFDDPAHFGKSFKDRLVVLDGVDLTAGIVAATTGHDASRVILTGSGQHGKNPSIDQYLAVEQGLGAMTPWSSLALAVGNDRSDLGLNVSYAAGGIPVPKWIDPAQTFAELFGSPVGSAERAELERQRRLGKSILDSALVDLAQLQARAPASERVKLEQHQTALREIERRLSRVEQACPAGPAPDPITFPRLRAYGGGERYFDAITDLQVDLLARAMSCDLTRFASLFLADLSRTGLFPELPEDIHGEVAHRYDARRDGHPGTPASWHALATQNRYSYSKVARLLQRLDEGGVLDDTVVYVSSDLGDPARHTSRNVPTLVIGSAGGVFKTGRYVDLRNGPTGVPNNRILVSLCQAFGVEVNRFGHASDPAIVSGRLDELYG